MFEMQARRRVLQTLFVKLSRCIVGIDHYFHLSHSSLFMTQGPSLWDRAYGAFALYEAEPGLSRGPTESSIMNSQDLFQIPVPAQDSLPASLARSAWEVISSIRLWWTWCPRCSHVLGGHTWSY